MLDGEVQPSQFAPDRIAADDVQQLLRRVDVEADPAMTGRFPEQLPCRVSVRLRGGATHTVNQAAYEGFRTRPMDWSSARTKFDRLAGGHADDRLRDAIADCIAGLESRPTRDLTALLGRVARTRNEPS